MEGGRVETDLDAHNDDDDDDDDDDDPNNLT
jgi:hypothetical protein